MDFITRALEMPIPYSLHSKVPEKSVAWEFRNDAREIISTLCK